MDSIEYSRVSTGLKQLTPTELATSQTTRKTAHRAETVQYTAAPTAEPGPGVESARETRVTVSIAINLEFDEEVGR